MNQANKDFIDLNLDHFMVLERAFYLRGLMVTVREGMLRILKEEFQPQFDCCMSCPTDIADMVKLLYRHYHDWLRKETGSTETYKDLTEGIESMNKLIVHASFPSNK